MENQNTIQDLKEDEPLRCGIYTRFSPRVKSENYTLENQIAMCRERAKQDNVQIDENHIYQDHHISGATTDRPDLSGADLEQALLNRADLSNVYLEGANLRVLFGTRRLSFQKGLRFLKRVRLRLSRWRL
mgnify:CR=1 FL=1